ncbi:MAG: 2OG-Fe(II) oxygenase [Pseudomonadota bacterium]
MQIKRLGAGVFTIGEFLSPVECVDFIARSESMGYSEAAVRTDDGDRVYGDARNNDRIILDDREFAASLYQRAQPLLPAEIDGWSVSGFNERLRYYRYDKQQQFVWHQDGTVRLSPTEESFLTFMIYLNDDFEGGSTDFGWESVKPTQGMALVFPHRLRHQGAVVLSGVKYVLRTDVLYAKSDA